MTDAQLTALSTIAWIIGTTATFVLLAHWSAGGSWGISTAIARGVIGWTGRNGIIAGEWPGDDVPPMANPELGLLWAGEKSVSPVAEPPAAAVAELVDLGSRRLP